MTTPQEQAAADVLAAVVTGGKGFPVSGTYAARRAERERCEEIARREVCARCGTTLAVANNPNKAGWPSTRCGRCNEYDPESVPTASGDLLVRWKMGQALSAIEIMQLENRLHRMISRAETNGKAPDPRWAAWLTELELPHMVNERQITVQAQTAGRSVALMTAADAERFINLADLRNNGNRALSPDLRRAVVEFMMVTGLSPALKEFTIYEGTIYPMADGYRSVINRSGKFDGMPAPPRYLTAQEKDARGIAAGKIAVEVVLQRKGQRFPIYGLGIADPAAPFRNNPVEKQFPQRMAETRAFRAACRAGFQDVLKGFGMDYDPDEESVVSESLQADEYIDSTAIEVEVDPDTGGLFDGMPQEDETEADELPTTMPATMTTTADQATPAQLNALGAVALRKGWSEAQLQEAAFNAHGATALADLTREQAGDLLRFMQATGDSTHTDHPIAGSTPTTARRGAQAQARARAAL